MDVSKKKRNKAEFLSLTGLTVPQFETLLPLFADRLHAHLSQWTWDGLERLRDYPPDPRFTPERLLMMALVRLRKGDDQTVLAELFDTSRGIVSQRLGVCTPLLLEALAEWEPQREEGFWRMQTGENQTIAMDGTERPIEKPGKNQKKTSA